MNMGSEFNYYIHSGTKEDLQSGFAEHQQDERHMNGTDTYAGHLGILNGLVVSNITPFASMEQARDYIDENHSKWESALAVPYRGEVHGFDASSKKVEQQRKALEKDIVNTQKRYLKSMKATKSKTIGCKACGSSITRKYLHSAKCPVCFKEEVFYSNTQRYALDKKKEKLSNLQQKPLKKVKKKGVVYVVGGNCPS
jgi:hypothetical protein